MTRAQRTQHLEPIALRQAEVEQHEVEAFARERALRGSGIAHPIDSVAFEPQRGTQAVADHAIVFD